MQLPLLNPVNNFDITYQKQPATDFISVKCPFLGRRDTFWSFEIYSSVNFQSSDLLLRKENRPMKSISNTPLAVFTERITCVCEQLSLKEN